MVPNFLTRDVFLLARGCLRYRILIVYTPPVVFHSCQYTQFSAEDPILYLLDPQDHPARLRVNSCFCRVSPYVSHALLLPHPRLDLASCLHQKGYNLARYSKAL